MENEIGENYGGLLIIEGYLQNLIGDYKPKIVAEIELENLKAKTDEIIKSTKKDLIEILRPYKGPRLSLDAPQIIVQSMKLYWDSLKLTAEYGEILSDLNWKKKLFKLSSWKTRLFRLDQ